MHSFYTEKTAEYALVPRFLEILSNLGDAAPIHFWKTREGNKTSQSIHFEDEVYVIAFFARRPKVTAGNTKLIQGKINSQLFDFAHQAQKLEVPVFCGLPETHSIFELANSSIKWFYLEPNLSGMDAVFNFSDIACEPLTKAAENIKPITEAEIIGIIKSCTYKVPWSVAVEKMAALHRNSEEKYSFAPWWTRNWHYKPIYFLIR